METQTKINLSEPNALKPAELQDEALAHSMERINDMPKKKNKTFAIGVGVSVLLGLTTGFVGANFTKSTISTTTQLNTSSSVGGQIAAMPGIKVGQVFGNKDASAYKDNAEGVLLPGGIGSEGSHHLVRAGGVSQNVYLTSSVMDLKMFENAKVKVFGETFKAQKAGWLMDVSRVEVEDLNAPLPDWVVTLQQKTNAANGGD